MEKQPVFFRERALQSKITLNTYEDEEKKENKSSKLPGSGQVSIGRNNDTNMTWKTGIRN